MRQNLLRVPTFGTRAAVRSLEVSERGRHLTYKTRHTQHGILTVTAWTWTKIELWDFVVQGLALSGVVEKTEMRSLRTCN